MSDAGQRKRLRSPPYPTLPLQRAIERAEQLYRQERDHATTITAAAKAWGVSPTSSSPIVTVAALKQFGLLVESADDNAIRKIRLTHDALRLILDKDQNSAARQEVLKKAFFTPKAFQEIWNKWNPDLPSDTSVINYLVLEKRLSNQSPYSEQAASELLANYRASLAFASPESAHSKASDSESADEEISMDHPDAPFEAKPLEGAAATPNQARQAVRQAVAQTVMLGESERVVFVEEGSPGQHVKLVVSGELDEFTLDALANYIERQKRRLGLPNQLN